MLFYFKVVLLEGTRTPPDSIGCLTYIRYYQASTGYRCAVCEWPVCSVECEKVLNHFFNASNKLYFHLTLLLLWTIRILILKITRVNSHSLKTLFDRLYKTK